ncbi:hypothetical protein [Bradyrhizobium sp. LB11.1]|uniref:hypothetical protein n=1 Tax=Bradyrhizobium sp. LB11.1 TaxID=3156326 RepID=UPI00339AB146
MQSDFAAQDAGRTAIARAAVLLRQVKWLWSATGLVSAKSFYCAWGCFDFFAIRASVMEPNGG